MKTHELEDKLKKLRLGGMLDTLELRLDQAQREGLGYITFLEMLLEDELNRRAQNALDKRIYRAHFDELKTLAEFDFTYNPKIPAQTVRDLGTCRFIERKESVLICGPVGVGKSHIAQALGYLACQMGYEVLYVGTSSLIRDLGGGHADGTFQTRLQKYIKPDLLILDDFGLRDFSPQQSEDLYELICGRYRSGSMIVASNRAPNDWYKLFANPVLAESALDRLINSAHYLLLAGRSYRPLHRPGCPSPISTGPVQTGSPDDPGDGNQG